MVTGPRPLDGRSRIVRGALSAAVLALIVVAVPVGLFALGGLPFVHMDVRAVREAIDHRSYSPALIAHWLIRGALFLGWISWAWMTMCVTIEATAKFTGRPPAPIPASRSLQSVAACLVGTTLAITSMGRTFEVPTAGAAGMVHIGSARPSAVLAGSRARGSESSRHLRVIDDPDTDDALFQRPLPGGGAIRCLIGEPVEPADDPSARNADHRVMPRETLWSIAEDRLGSPLRWKEIAELNYGVPQSDGGALTSDHWIRPGWTLEMPLSPARLGAFTAGVGGSRSGSDPHGPDDQLPVAGGSGGLHDPKDPPMPVGGGVVGAGVIGLLDRMRRVQQRHRRAGTYIRLPGPAQSQFERRLRLGEGREIVRDVDVALRLLADVWADGDADIPIVMGLTVHPDSIDVAVDRIGAATRIPAPFSSGRDEGSLSVPREDLPVTDPDVGGGIHPAPLLVTAGTGAGGLVMVNLESLGTLLVNGDRGGCEGVVRALALELATSQWSGGFDLATVGFGSELVRFDRVEAVDDVALLLDRLHRRRLRAQVRLHETGFRSFAHARGGDSSGIWDPIVVLCGPSVTAADVAELLGVASDPRFGIAVVASGPAARGHHGVSLAVLDRAPSLEFLGAVLHPQQVEPAELREVSHLMETAMNRQSVFLSDEPYVNLPVRMPMPLPEVENEHGPDPHRSEPPLRSSGRVRRGDDGTVGVRGRPRDSDRHEHEVEVAVLGEVEVRGAARQFTRAWAKELVVYLALHPRGASNDAWATALWPDRVMAPSSLHSTASVARRSLGQAADGHDHLPRSHGRLALSDSVGTDWGRFVVHADSNDTGRWRCALELVRGRPLEGLRSSDWPILEGIGPAIEAAVVDLSGRLAGSCLSGGDPTGAEWAARKGLLASPYDERLYRMLMRAADLAGNPAGVEAAMSELIRLVADDIEPLDSVHPSTMDLYRSLTRRRIRKPMSP